MTRRPRARRVARPSRGRCRDRRRASPAAVLACVVAVLGALAAGCGAGATSTGEPGLTPVPGAPSDGAPGDAPTVAGRPSAQSFQDAVDRLDALASWRYTVTQQAEDGSGGTSRGVVVNGTPHRTRTDELDGGRVAISTVQVGAEAWTRTGDGPWQADTVDGGGALPIDPGGGPAPIDDGGGEGDWSNPLDGVLWVVTDAPGAVVADLGLERRGGVMARHLRATVTQAAGAGATDVSGMGFVGTVEAWIAADRGYLLAARAQGATTTQAYGDDGRPAGSPDTASFRLEVAVDGVDGPANVVEPPDVRPATPPPSGDPAVVALIGGIRAAQAALDRYQLTISTAADGAATTLEATVVNRPVRAVRIESSGDGDDLASLVIGEQAWIREGGGAWVAADPSELPFCLPPEAAAGPPDCLEVLTGLLEPAEALAGTFRRVGEETVDGVRAVHLRSDAGLGTDGMSLPGTTDVWVADEGGWLVRFAFAGADVTDDVRTTRPNDPSIRLDPPMLSSPAP